MPPLKEASSINPKAMVVGGGLSGMARQASLARQGYESHIIERSDRLGGQAVNLYRTAKGEDVQQKLAALIADIGKNDKIRVHLQTEIAAVEGFVGNFKTTLVRNGQPEVLEHGVAVIAPAARRTSPRNTATAPTRAS